MHEAYRNNDSGNFSLNYHSFTHYTVCRIKKKEQYNHYILEWRKSSVLIYVYLDLM